MKRFITSFALVAGLAISSLALAAGATPAATAAPTTAPAKHASVKKVCHDNAGKTIKCEKKAPRAN